ncbi:protein-glutamate O-methyltransferase CheR [Caulobacter sp. 17J80-11]|uniref:CheR family methyltransferase n=1 Tax=Caulobacter sp. 17J80-11 TaxID=2763502 RepID=UPI0016536FE5|nr:protein-glutamate O-methyltransferase CheR [Caulobacter sp. 17J80-11]MBC6980917.1 protein-glutamate O-methyltransferase CheR [Caulobacter sp. 17J80-11]
MAADPEDLKHFAALLKAGSGFVLTRETVHLVEGRLAPLARREGYGTVEALLAALRKGADARLKDAAVGAMASTETFFFRDLAVFERLRDHVLPALAQARPGGRVRAWSAGCATGQEAWSLAIAGEEAASNGAKLSLEVTGTDLSRACLEKAEAGLYTQFEVQRGLPARLLVRWFNKIDEMWRVSSRLRGDVRFRRVNLVEDFTGPQRFDLILCRNVLDGFDAETRATVLRRLASRLAEDGVLVLGAGESPRELGQAFAALPGARGVFVKLSAARKAA